MTRSLSRFDHVNEFPPLVGPTNRTLAVIPASHHVGQISHKQPRADLHPPPPSHHPHLRFRVSFLSQCLLHSSHTSALLGQEAPDHVRRAVCVFFFFFNISGTQTAVIEQGVLPELAHLDSFPDGCCVPLGAAVVGDERDH